MQDREGRLGHTSPHHGIGEGDGLCRTEPGMAGSISWPLDCPEGRAMGLPGHRYQCVSSRRFTRKAGLPTSAQGVSSFRGRRYPAAFWCAVRSLRFRLTGPPTDGLWRLCDTRQAYLLRLVLDRFPVPAQPLAADALLAARYPAAFAPRNPSTVKIPFAAPGRHTVTQAFRTSSKYRSLTSAPTRNG